MNTEHKENNLDLTIMRDTLLPAVKDAASAVSKRSTLPVLGNVKLAATEDSLTISGTDLNVFVERTVWPKEVIPGAITVNAKALLDALKAAPKGTLVSLTAIEGNKLVLTTSTGKVTLNGIHAEEFPVNTSFLEGEHITAVAGDVLKRAIAEVEFAAADDAARPVLQVISMKFMADRILFAAADNYQVAVTEIPAQSSAEVQLLPEVVGMRLAAKILPDSTIQVAYGKRFVSFAWAGGTISVSIYDGQYPNYQQVIPVSSATDLTLERAPFMAAIKTAANVAKDAANVIRFTINGTLKVEASSDTGDVSEEVPAEISGDAIRIGLNAKLISNVAKVPDADNLRWSLNSPLSPSVMRRNIDGDPWMLVTMPVRMPN